MFNGRSCRLPICQGDSILARRLGLAGWRPILRVGVYRPQGSNADDRYKQMSDRVRGYCLFRICFTGVWGNI